MPNRAHKVRGGNGSASYPHYPPFCAPESVGNEERRPKSGLEARCAESLEYGGQSDYQGIIISTLPMMKAAAATGRMTTGVRYQAGWGCAIGCTTATGIGATATGSGTELRVGASSKTAGSIWRTCAMHQESVESGVGCSPAGRAFEN